eukprot:COSAG01_NODE_606_length_14864_cov_190.098327_6_plen_103_part_00
MCSGGTRPTYSDPKCHIEDNRTRSLLHVQGSHFYMGSLISKPQMCLSGVTTNGYLDPPAGNRLGVGQVTLLINRVAHHVVRGLVLQSLLDSTELGIMMVEND